MSNSIELQVNDFDLFLEVLKSAVKIVDSAKLLFNSAGMQIYGARSKLARCELVTDAVCASKDIDASVLDLGMVVKVLSTVKDVHEGDYSGLKLIVEKPYIKISSKKFKSKLTLCNEDVIAQWVSKKVEAKLTPLIEFKTTSDLIRRVSSQSFMFSDPASLRLYIGPKDGMENNAVFATLASNDTALSNEVTMKLGLLTSGKMPEGRKIIIDLERLSLFNSLASNDIQVSFMDMNVLVSRTRLSAKNGHFFDLAVYSTILKS